MRRVFRLRIGDREYHREIADAAVRGKRLGPIEDPMFPVAPGGGPGTAGIAAGGRFGETPGADCFPLGQGNQITAFLGFGSELEDVIRAQGCVRRHRKSYGGVGTGNLLDDSHVMDVVKTGPPVLGREDHSEETQFPEVGEDFTWKRLIFVVMQGLGADLRLAELSQFAEDDPTFLRQAEIHDWCASRAA